MKKLLAIAFAAAVVFAGCDYTPSADQQQNEKQEQLVQQGINSVGMPAIVHFFEKRQYKTIYELRDRAISTTTYLVDRDGHLHKLCDSIGYGIPYATQYTNPQHFDQAWAGSSAYAPMPQADPNGLYSPATAAGTWVLCLDPKERTVKPLYSEPDIVVSQYALQTQ